MPEPEIARRCHACGAAIRVQAAFCPQCGKALAKKTSEGAGEDEAAAIHDTEEIIVKDITLTEADFRRTKKAKPKSQAVMGSAKAGEAAPETRAQIQEPEKPVSEKPPLETGVVNDSAEANQEGKIPPTQNGRLENVVTDVPRAASEAANPKPAGRVGARIQRATNRARDMEGNVAHRVQKFREISSVVIDEAAYDPSLRFVLVAGVLFLLFLLIVLLNKLIG